MSVICLFWMWFFWYSSCAACRECTMTVIRNRINTRAVHITLVQTCLPFSLSSGLILSVYFRSVFKSRWVRPGATTRHKRHFSPLEPGELYSALTSLELPAKRTCFFIFEISCCFSRAAFWLFVCTRQFQFISELQQQMLIIYLIIRHLFRHFKWL